MEPSVSLTQDTLEALEASLLNTSGLVPLHDRLRTLFTLRVAQEQEKEIVIIGDGFTDQSALLKHELAYVLGQMKDPYASPTLERVLRDLKEDPMVRHEAAKAMGAISSVQSIPTLNEFLNGQRREVREMCEIALARVEWDNSAEGKAEMTKSQKENPLFTSEVPAPPLPSSFLRPSSSLSTSYTDADVSALTTTLLDPSLSLFNRYRPLFTLRNIGTPAAIDALSSALLSPSDSWSPLFKHEVAFVFGLTLDPYSVPALLKVLEDERERKKWCATRRWRLWVGSTDDVLPVSWKWSAKDDAPRVIRESCVVAIDIWEYKNSNQFQHVNGLDAVNFGTSHGIVPGALIPSRSQNLTRYVFTSNFSLKSCHRSRTLSFHKNKG